MTASGFRKTTALSQSAFSEYRHEVISTVLAQGHLPNNRAIARLLALESSASTDERKDLLHQYALSHKPLADLVGQYVDGDGSPKAAVNHNGAVKDMDPMACFGRACGYAPMCWEKCSIGPSRRPDGGLPAGATEGAAILRHPSGYAMSEEPVRGVLCQEPDPVDGSPRLRTDACPALSLFCHVFAIPPAPTGALADALYDLVAETIAHVESRLSGDSPASPAPPAPAPTPASAPPPAPPVESAPPRRAAHMPPVESAPAAPPPPPPVESAPPPPPPLPAQTEAPPPPAPLPPKETGGTEYATTLPAESPEPAVSEPSGDERYFDDTLIEQEWELQALYKALQNCDDMSSGRLRGIVDRNRDKSYKQFRSALFKAAAGRDLTTGPSLKIDRLKREFWPEDVEIPQGYYEGGGVHEETISAPPALADTPRDVRSSTYSIRLQPGAPEVPRERVDVEVPEPVPPAEEAETVRETPAASPAKSERAHVTVTADTGGKVVDFVDIGKALSELTAAVQDLAAAQREHTALLLEGMKPTRGGVPAEPPRRKTKSAPAKPSRKSEETLTNPAPTRQEPQGAPEGYELLRWQPGSRGRPPLDVKKNKKGEYVFPRSYKLVNGKWYAPKR